MTTKILDCTLRDGGYYTNWDFSQTIVENYFEAFNSLPVDYLEIGYRSNPLNPYLGEYFYCPPYLLEKARSLSTKKLAIILNEKDVRAEDVESLLSPCVGLIDLVRIAVDPSNFDRAVKLAEAVKAKGFEVAFNVMYMSSWPERKEFIQKIGQINGIVDIFYMVDSFGGVYPNDVKEIFGLVREQTNVPIGFHGHNNLELALINTLTAVECGAEIIDATVTGMGRGAGNLKTELLLTALNEKQGVQVDFNALSGVVADFEELREKHGWGTNLPYMVSGANSLPQKDVMEWVTRRFYSMNSIIRALNNQKSGVQDNQQLPNFVPANQYKEVIIVGGGPSAVEQSGAIKQFISRKGDIAIIHASSKNAAAYQDLREREQFFCLVGNEGKRMEKVFHGLQDFNGLCILPPFPRKMGTYIPEGVLDSTFELSEISFVNKLTDTHTALAIQTALSLGAEKCWLIGYDGYKEGSMNQMERELYLENEYLFAKAAGEIQVTSLFPTAYSIDVESIFSYLI